MSFHKLDKAKDKNFWSVRVSSDIRLIVHKSEASLLLCYVDHHDKAYDWAERRKLETHPKTGAAQLVEIRETVQGDRRPGVRADGTAAAPAAAEKPPLFADTVRRRAAGLRRARRVARRRQDGDRGHAAGAGRPPACRGRRGAAGTGDRRQAARAAAASRPAANPFDHPDAQRRFRVMTNVEELERALDIPWEKWTVFLHPEQRQWVERDYTGPARVSGSAGTGKTIVALHRAVHLARTQSRCPGAADDVLRHAGERAAHQAEAADRQRAAARRADRRSLARRHRPAALQGARRAGRRSPAARSMRELLRRGVERGRRPQVQPAFPAHRVGAGRRCLAAGDLGGVSRRRAPRPQDAAARGAARGAVVDLRARSCRAAGARS